MDARAQNLYEMTKIEEERFIQECKMKVLRIKNELNKHRDLSVKSTTSLEVGNGFDPKAWVTKRHQLERDLRVANIEYALALKVLMHLPISREEIQKAWSNPYMNLSELGVPYVWDGVDYYERWVEQVYKKLNNVT